MTSQLEQRTMSGILWSTVGHWGYRGLNLGLFVLLSRLLSAEDFGLVAMSMVYIAFLQVFLEQGFSEAVVQRWELSNDLPSTAFWTNTGLGMLLCGATFVASPIVSVLLQDSALVPVIRGLSPLFVIIGLASVPMALLRREMRFELLAKASIVGAVIGGACSIAVTLRRPSVWALVVYQVMSRLTEAVLVWVLGRWRPSLRFSFADLGGLVAFGANIVGSRLLSYVNRYGADFVIGLYLGSVSLGYYSLAFRLTRTLIELMASVVSRVALPAFSRTQLNPGAGSRLYSQMVRQIGLWSMPLFVGLALVAGEVVDVVFGQKWSSSVPLMKVLALVGVVHSLYYVNNSVLLGYGKPSWRLLFDGINAVVNLIVVLIAVRWGIYAVAVACTVQGYATAPFALGAALHLLGLRTSEYLKLLVPAVLGTMVMTASVSAVRLLVSPFLQASVVLLVLCIGVGCFAYATAILVVAPGTLQRTYLWAKAAVGLKAIDPL